MRVRHFVQGLVWVHIVAMMACESTPSSDWVLLSEDSDGQPTYIDAESIRLGDDGVAVYRRLVGDTLATSQVDFLQALDCVNLRWAFLTLDETLLDSIARTTLETEEWSALALTPANRTLLDEVCSDYSPTRWIRVLRNDTEEAGELKEVWVDRESITGPHQDSVRTEMEDLGLSEDVFRSLSRWHDAVPDSGYLMIQAEVACDKGALRYLENSRYSPEGELLRETETPDLWFPMFRDSFEDQVFSVVCEMEDFFRSEPTPGTFPEGD